jgi:hypothetical protein
MPPMGEARRSWLSDDDNPGRRFRVKGANRLGRAVEQRLKAADVLEVGGDHDRGYALLSRVGRQRRGPMVGR